MCEENVSAGDLMSFLKKFQTNMEAKIEATNSKIDNCLNNVDKEFDKVNTKIDENKERADAVTIRMDKRLSALEREMTKVNMNRRRNEELKEKEKELENQQAGRSTMSNQLEKQTGKVPSDKVKVVTEEILREPPGFFRSSWAKGIQMQLQRAS